MTPNPDRPGARDRRDELLEALSARLDGEASPAEAARLDAELARDPELRSMSDRLAALSAALRDLPPISAPETVLSGVRSAIAAEAGSGGASSRRSSSRSGAWAALFLVAALGLVWWQLERSGPDRLEEGKLARTEDAETETGPPAASGLAAPERELESARGKSDAGDLSARVPAGVAAPPPAEEASKDRAAAADSAATATDVAEDEERPRTLREAKTGQTLGAPSRPRGAAPADGRAGGAGGAGAAIPRPADEIDSALELKSEEPAGAALGAEIGEAPPPPPPAAPGAWGEPGATAAELRFRPLGSNTVESNALERDGFAVGAPPAELTIRVPVPEGTSPADLERLAAALTLALGRPLAKDAAAPAAGAPGAAAPEPDAPESIVTGGDDARRESLAKAKEAGIAGAPRADAERRALEPVPGAEMEDAEAPLPAEVELAIPADRLLAAVRLVRRWQRTLGSDGDGAATPSPPSQPAETALEIPDRSAKLAGGEAGPTLGVTILDGFSFDADPETLDRFLEELVAGRGPVVTSGEAAATGAAAPPTGGGSAEGRKPLRIRIVVHPDRPAEPGR